MLDIFSEKVKKYFFTGLISLLPVLMTFYLLGLFINWADKILGVPVSVIFFKGQRIPGLGLIISFFLILLIGVLAEALFLRRFFGWFEANVLFKIPLVKNIYSSAKQINDILFLQKYTGAFRRVCALEYPRKGLYSIGFITNSGVSEVQNKLGKKLVNVFVPSTPTPATGFVIVVPEDEVILLEMSLEQGIKFVVSGGVLSPSLTGSKNT